MRLAGLWSWQVTERAEVRVVWQESRVRPWLHWKYKRHVNSRLWYLNLGRLFLRFEVVSRAWWAQHKTKWEYKPRG